MSRLVTEERGVHIILLIEVFIIMNIKHPTVIINHPVYPEGNAIHWQQEVIRGINYYGN